MAFEERIHQDGVNHIKDTLAERSSETTPASAANTSSTAATGTDSSAGIIDTVKSYLGYSNTEGTSDTTAGSLSSTISSGISSAAAAAGLTPSATSASASKSTAPEVQRDNANAQTHGAEIKEAVDPVTNTQSNPSESDAADAPAPSNPAQESKPKPASGGGSLENKSAIPTAGGQRLGEAHWGESTVVPELPPKPDESAGATSDETKANTAKNSGGAAGTDASKANQDSQPKESSLDKIKDKLNFHKKN